MIRHVTEIRRIFTQNVMIYHIFYSLIIHLFTDFLAMKIIGKLLCIGDFFRGHLKAIVIDEK